MAADKQAIKEITGVACSVRARNQWSGQRCLTLAGPANKLDKALALCYQAIEKNEGRDRSAEAGPADAAEGSPAAKAAPKTAGAPPAKAMPQGKGQKGKEQKGKGKQAQQEEPSKRWHWGEQLQRRSMEHESELADQSRQLRGLSAQVRHLTQTCHQQQAAMTQSAGQLGFQQQQLTQLQQQVTEQQQHLNAQQGLLCQQAQQLSQLLTLCEQQRRHRSHKRRRSPAPAAHPPEDGQRCFWEPVLWSVNLGVHKAGLWL